MSWYQGLYNLATRVVKLDSRVTDNTKQIKTLQVYLKNLTESTGRVARAVNRNQETSVHKYEILVLQLQAQLSNHEREMQDRLHRYETEILTLRLELNLNPNPLDHHNGAVAPPHILPSSNETRPD